MPTDAGLIVITEFGMASSLGLDAVSAVAAARAGMRRATELEFQVIDRNTNDPESVIGHCIPFAATGFEGLGRLLRIAQLAFDDFNRSVQAGSLEVKRCGFLAALPDPRRSTRPLPDEQGNVTEYENVEWTETPDFSDNIGQKLLQIGGRPDLSAEPVVRDADHVSVTDLIGRASEGLQGGRWDCCLIAVFDSLLDRPTLQWLFDQHRLKCAANPVGLQPGEAGAVLMLETAAHARQRGAPIRGVVEGTALGQDENHLYSGKPPLGVGLAQVVQRLNDDIDGGIATNWVVSDLNGEVHRSTDWGTALVRLVPAFPALREVHAEYPAASFGDTGAASGAAALATVLHAFSRKCSPHRQAIILSSADHGRRGALAIRNPEA
jgi:3-oxoacyl-[acyl-carrier-protein] synthase I